jgi:hypothetical protein
MSHDVLSTLKSRAYMLEAEAGGTVIETKVGPFWRKDGTDDKVPLPSAE